MIPLLFLQQSFRDVPGLLPIRQECGYPFWTSVQGFSSNAQFTQCQLPSGRFELSLRLDGRVSECMENKPEVFLSTPANDLLTGSLTKRKEQADAARSLVASCSNGDYSLAPIEFHLEICRIHCRTGGRVFTPHATPPQPYGSLRRTRRLSTALQAKRRYDRIKLNATCVFSGEAHREKCFPSL